MKYIVFGTGLYWENRKDKIEDEVILFFDNDVKKWDSTINGVKIVGPSKIKNVEYDYILIMSKSILEMTTQLIELGIPKTKILTWNDYYLPKKSGRFILHNVEALNENKNVVIFSTELIISGGMLASLYCAEALKMKNYNVTIATPEENEDMVELLLNKGISVCIMTTLPYLFESEIAFLKKYDFAIVNTLQMVVCAELVSSYIPSFWWIHEPSDKYCAFYQLVDSKFPGSLEKESIEKLNIFCVSEVAKKAFFERTKYSSVGIMQFGIPDIELHKKKNEKKLVIAGIGNISSLKGQKDLAEAFCMLDKVCGEDVECWFIGKIQEQDYFLEILNITKWNNVRYLGALSREDMKIALENIDVVVCTSKEETMSMTIVEGMMAEKVCVTTDNTGIAYFMDDGIDGFVVKEGDVKGLSKILSKIINTDCSELRRNARRKYEELFTMKSFAERLEKEINRIESDWKL